ncbi:hypothetical protein ENSA7_64980 [Enhygromyxa salina]|uniref:Uncharacterized protein n=1 Tax=Enhygromyxa salina TaxID=215803 RepID=A0A2S9Y0C2_9BACT|nr:hypothetical protein ENSA7_64980 [Enhygromyxa salina]
MFSNDAANQTVDRRVRRVPEQASDVLVDHRGLVSINSRVDEEVSS